MASTYTANLKVEKPGDGEQSGSWGGTVNANMDLLDAYLCLCAEDEANHSGLDFYYLAGRVWDGTTLTAVAAGHVTLTDDDTNYVEVDPADGTVSANVVGFTAGSLPLFEVVAASGAISTVTPKHVFLAAAGSSSGGGDGNADVRGWVPGDMFIKTGAGRVLVTRAGTITKTLLHCGTGPTGADIICDIHLNGTSIWDTTQANRVTITAGNTSASQTSFDTTVVAEGDEIRLDIDQIGSTLPGSELTWALLITPS